MAEVKERNTEERATRMAERIWRETIDDSKLDIKRIRAICLFYLIAERDQAVASHAPATAESDVPLDVQYEKLLVRAASLLTNLVQIVDVCKQEWGPSWSEWDQTQRQGITDWLRLFYARNTLADSPAPSAPEEPTK